MIAECPCSEACAAPSCAACSSAAPIESRRDRVAVGVGGVQARERGEVLLGARVQRERRQRVAAVGVIDAVGQVRRLVAVLGRDGADRVGDDVAPS